MYGKTSLQALTELSEAMVEPLARGAAPVMQPATLQAYLGSEPANYDDAIGRAEGTVTLSLVIHHRESMSGYARQLAPPAHSCRAVQLL
jgi:hypothetical protein